MVSPAVVLASVALFFAATTCIVLEPCAVVRLANILPPPWSVTTFVVAL